MKQSRNRPSVARKVPVSLGSQIFMTIGTWRLWGCQGHAPGAFTTRKCSWYSFSLGAESTPGPWYGRKEICHWKIQWHHREFFLFIKSNCSSENTIYIYISSSQGHVVDRGSRLRAGTRIFFSLQKFRLVSGVHAASYFTNNGVLCKG
jgi:hypothetical protein